LDPDLILADEPTGNPDATSVEEILKLLSLLSRKFEKTIVMVTHDPHAASYSDAQYHLQKGKLLGKNPMAGFETAAEVRRQTAR
jgi:putative ABC transport system ATP-binding protein